RPDLAHLALRRAGELAEPGTAPGRPTAHLALPATVPRPVAPARRRPAGSPRVVELPSAPGPGGGSQGQQDPGAVNHEARNRLRRVSRRPSSPAQQPRHRTGQTRSNRLLVKSSGNGLGRALSGAPPCMANPENNLAVQSNSLEDAVIAKLGRVHGDPASGS